MSAIHSKTPAVATRATGATASSVAPVLLANECKCEPVLSCTTGVMCGTPNVTTSKELVTTGSTGGATGAGVVSSATPLPSLSTGK